MQKFSILGSNLLFNPIFIFHLSVLLNEFHMKRSSSRIKFLILVLPLLGFMKMARAQNPTYELYFTNVVTTPNTIAWDAYLLRTGTVPLQLATIQFGFGYDISILNGGTLTASVIPGSDLPASMQPSVISVGTINYSSAPVPVGQTHRYINVAAKTPPGAANAPLISNVSLGCTAPGTKIGRFQIMNSVNWAPNSEMHQVFSTAVGSARTKTQINAYIGINNTNITDNASHLSYNVAGTCDQGVLLNPSSGCIFSGSGTTTASLPCSPTGTALITLTGANAPAQGTYTLDGGSAQPFSSNPFTITGLSAGNHTIFTLSSGGCLSNGISINVSTYVITITPSPGWNACTNSGSVVINVSGGAQPYSYSLDGVTYQPGNVFSGLSVGNHTVYVKDANGCNATTTVSVSGPNIDITTLNSAGCGGNTGKATLNVSNGFSTYTYSLDGITYQSINLFTELAAGNYIAYVKDANGCVITKAFTIGIMPIIIEPTVIAPTSCLINGSIQIFLSQNCLCTVGTLSYSLDNITYQASNTFSNLAAGNYTAYVKDANGCVGTKPITIIDQSVEIGIYRIIPSRSCVNTGAIYVLPIRGVSPFSYSLDGSTYQLSSGFNNLAPGTYTCYIKDAVGCVNSINATVGINPVRVSYYRIASSSCVANGSLLLFAANQCNCVVTPVSYSLDNITYQTGNTFTGLAAGTYTAYIKDALGCIGSTTATVQQYAPVSVTARFTNSSTCINNGTIQANDPTGGQAPFTYSLNGTTFQASKSFAGLAAGTYTLTAKDIIGCLGTTTVTIAQNQINVTAYAWSAGNCTADNGKIQLFRLGGVNPYMYSLDGINYQASSLFTNLTAGTYPGYVKDALGCVGTLMGIEVGPAGCNSLLAGNKSNNIEQGPVSSKTVTLNVRAFPNPSDETFTVLPEGYDRNEKILVTVTDILGRIVYQATGTGKPAFTFGKELKAGTYILQVVQGNEKKIIKLIKQ